MQTYKACEPLYKRIKQQIIAEIEAGQYPEGKQIPPERELSILYNVSRITIRNAISELVNENYLKREQGRGTFVSRKKWDKNLSVITSFTDMCRSMNCVPDAKVIKLVIEEATEMDHTYLSIPIGDPVIVIERIRYADSVPVSLEINRFIQEYAFLLSEDLNHCSMYELIKTKHGLTFEHASRFVEIKFADLRLSTYLNVKKQHPILSLSGTTSDNEGRLACYTEQLIIGDKFRLTLM